MGFYFLDRAQDYVQNTLGLSLNPGQQKLDPIAGGSRYNRATDTIELSRGSGPSEDAEDPEVVLHEYLHVLHEDACPGFVTHGAEGPKLAEGLSDFFASALLAHEPQPFDRVWAEWSAQDATGIFDSGYGRTVANQLMYPYAWHPSPHVGGLLASGAMWSVFQAYESVLGACPTGVGDGNFLAACTARDRLATHLLMSFSDMCSEPSLRGLAESLVNQEIGAGPPNVALIQSAVDALDSRGLFFNQQEEPWGATFEPVALPGDQTIPANAVVRVRIVNSAYPVDPSSVVLSYGGTDGPFTGSTAMTLIGADTFVGVIPSFPLETLVRYRIDATNGLGVTVHWPKTVSPSHPLEDAAVFYVGTAATRTTMSHSVGGSGGQTILPGTSTSFDFLLGSNAQVTDVSCHVVADGAKLGMVRIELINPATAAALFYNDVADVDQHLSSITAFDWWFDDARRAPYNQVGPFAFGEDVPNDPDLALLTGSGLAGTWTVTVTNPPNSVGTQPLTVRDVELQITTGDLPVGIEELSAPAIPAALGPGHPNPFVDRISIPIWLPSDSTVELKIFDVTGRAVQVIRRDLRRGEHTLSWDRTTASGDRVPSGVYFYQLRTPGFVGSRKMVVAR